MWSGVHEVHPVKNRDTNTFVENWFRIIKYNVFENKRYNFKNFVEKLYLDLEGRYIDRKNILKMQSVAKNKTKIAKRKVDNSSSSLAAERKKKLMMQSVAKNQTKIAKRKLDDSSSSLAAEM